MKIVYLNSKQEPEPTSEDVLLSAIRKAIPMVEVISFTDCHAFSEWLKVPPRIFFAAILNPGNYRSLHQLMPLRRLLVDRKIILVVPEQHERDIALVHKFRPHYIQWMHDDCSALISILQNWLATFQELDQQIETRHQHHTEQRMNAENRSFGSQSALAGHTDLHSHSHTDELHRRQFRK